MTLHELLMTALTHPLQMLCIGLVVGRTMHAAAEGLREQRRVRVRMTAFRRPPTAARVAM